MHKRLKTKLETKVKRKTQVRKIVELKIDKSHLSKSTKSLLYTLFKEAKYFFNYCLSLDDLSTVDTKIKSVPVVTPNGIEERELSVLSSQMKQAIHNRIFSNIKTLHTLKEKGFKVGWIGFTSNFSSIPLKQAHVTYEIENNYLRLQGIKKKIKLSGTNQIPDNYELANAHLIKRNNDFFLHVTCYMEKDEEYKEEQKLLYESIKDKTVCIDLGCETQVTLDNGIKIKYEVPVNKRIRKISRRINRNKKNNTKNKNSRNMFKKRLLLQKEYNKLNNKKRDIKNKIVSVLRKNYKYVCYQEDSIASWQKNGHGKKINKTGLGGLISILKDRILTPVPVSQFFPSTKTCSKCGKKKKVELDERIYICDNCKLEIDRDINAAINIKREGMSKIPDGLRELTLQETVTSASQVFNSLKGIEDLTVSYCR